MGLFGDFVKEAIGSQARKMEDLVESKAREMSDSEILRGLENPNVKPVAYRALKEEAERRGLR